MARSWVALALTFLLNGCGADAMDQTNEDLTSPQGGMLRLAEQMHAEGDDQGAMAFYGRAVQRAPNDVGAHVKLAALLEDHKDYVDAAEQYRILVTLKPDDASYHRDYGRDLIRLGKVEEAKSEYAKAVALDPDDVKALNGEGVAIDMMGDHQGALSAYETALKTAPNDLMTINNLGHSYVLSGNYDAAIKTLEPAYQNAGAPAALRENLATAYAMQGLDIDAERVLRIDMSATETSKLMVHYHNLRKTSAAPLVFANLGSFSTADLAGARLDKVHDQFGQETAPLTLEVIPKIQAAGGTPDFFAEATGFKSLDEATRFCSVLNNAQSFCKAREN